MELNSIKKSPHMDPQPSSRRQFFQQVAWSLMAMSIPTKLAKSQPTQTLREKLYKNDPETCLKLFLGMILEEASIKAKVDASNFQILCKFNDGELQELYDEAIATVEESGISKQRLDQITTDLMCNLLLNQKYPDINSVTQAFDIGNSKKVKRLIVIPYGPQTETFESPLNAVKKIISQIIIAVEAKEANKKAAALGKEPEPVRVLALTHLEKAKALSESFARAIADKYGKDEPLLKDLEKNVIRSFAKDIEEIKATNRQKIFDPQEGGRFA